MVSEAGCEVVVDDARGLHEGVDHCGSHAPKASRHHVFADDLCFRGLDRHLTRVPKPVPDGLLVREAPTVIAKGAQLLLNLQMD